MQTLGERWLGQDLCPERAFKLSEKIHSDWVLVTGGKCSSGGQLANELAINSILSGLGRL